LVSDKDYLTCFGIDQASCRLSELVKMIFSSVESRIPSVFKAPLEVIINKGSLAQRILSRLGQEVNELSIREVYRELARCLKENQLFQ